MTDDGMKAGGGKDHRAMPVKADDVRDMVLGIIRDIGLPGGEEKKEA